MKSLLRSVAAHFSRRWVELRWSFVGPSLLRYFASGTSASIVAEGIETEAQLDVIQSMGVDLGQGFLFGRPQPLADLNFSVVRAAARTRAA